MTSKAERRRRAKAHPFDLAPVAGRQPSGRRASEPADRLALDARARHLGLTLTVTEALREARAPWWGCLAGRQMAEDVRDEEGRQAFWRAICHMRRVQAAYDASLGAPRRHAACLAVLTPVRALSADAASPAPDLRPEEERVAAAARAWEEMEVCLLSAPASSRAAARALVLDDQGDRWAFARAKPALIQMVRGLTGDVPCRHSRTAAAG